MHVCGGGEGGQTGLPNLSELFSRATGLTGDARGPREGARDLFSLFTCLNGGCTVQRALRLRGSGHSSCKSPDS